MEKISVQQLLVWQAFKRDPSKWLSNTDIHTVAPAVADRTIRHHVKRLFNLGILDKIETFPDRYRLAADCTNQAYAARSRRLSMLWGSGFPRSLSLSADRG